MKYLTEQEEFWAGIFGDEYISRNQDKRLIAANIALFSKILSRTSGISSVLEFGSNIGLNLIAIRQILPDAEISAIEINKKAAKILKDLGFVNVYHQSIFEFQPDQQRDFVFSKGVLIHINPDLLPRTYQLMYNSTRKYICIAEYFNTFPQEVPYRGIKERLFKRDFAGELLDKFPDLELVDYGFEYSRDPQRELQYNFDNITWFLLKKRM